MSGAVHREFEISDVPAMTAAAERFDSFADIAELMDDLEGASQWRTRAAELRLRAMSLLDGRAGEADPCVG